MRKYDLIPKIIHQIWVGDKPIPTAYIYYRKTWINHHPDWSFMIWTDHLVNNTDLMNRASYDAAWSPCVKADMLRFEVLYKFGGVHIDADMECLRPIDPLLEGDFMVSELSGMLAHAFMGAVPRHPLVKRVLADMPRRLILKRSIHDIAGLRMFREHAEAFGLENIVVHPDHYFYHDPCIYARHHFGASWMEKEYSPSPCKMLL